MVRIRFAILPHQAQSPFHRRVLLFLWLCAAIVLVQPLGVIQQCQVGD